MKFELFMNFNGNARDAMELYARVFKSEIKDVALFGDAPADPNYPILPGDRDRIMYATVKIADKNIMFMDMASDQPVVMGNNIMPVITIADHAEIDRIFTELGAGGTVIMAPQKMFFSEYYSMFIDRFGVTWQIYSPVM